MDSSSSARHLLQRDEEVSIGFVALRFLSFASLLCAVQLFDTHFSWAGSALLRYMDSMMEDSIFDDDAGSSDYEPEVAPVWLFILDTSPSDTGILNSSC